MYIDGATCQTRRNDAGQQRCRSVGLSVRQSDDLAPAAPGHIRPPFIRRPPAPELPIALAVQWALRYVLPLSSSWKPSGSSRHPPPRRTHAMAFNCTEQLEGEEGKGGKSGA